MDVVHPVIPEVSETLCVVVLSVVSGAEDAEHVMDSAIHVYVLKEMTTCKDPQSAEERPWTSNWTKPETCNPASVLKVKHNTKC